MLALRDPQLGHDRVQAELVDRGPVDPAHERPGEPVHDRRAEAAAQERPDRDVLGRSIRGQTTSFAIRILLGPGEQPRPREGHGLRREHEAQALGHRHELAAVADVHGARIAGAHQLVAQRELAAERDGRRPGGEERVRAHLQDQPFGPLRRDLAAQARARLDEGDRHAVADEGTRGGEAGDPTADDQDAHDLGPTPSRRRGRCRSGRTGRAGRTRAGRPSTRRRGPASRRRRARTRRSRSGP